MTRLPLRFTYKMTSELTPHEIHDILGVLNTTWTSWGDELAFRWKYFRNPYGDSLHVIAYDESQAVGSVGFWRNDLNGTSAYQCVDLAVIPSYQRRGIFRTAASQSVTQLEGAYLYTFPNINSRPGFFDLGWSLKRRLPISFHLPDGVLRHYEQREPVPDQYAEWRFVRHPSKQYYVCHHGGQSFLLSKRRNHCYAIGGMLSSDFGLQVVRPRFLISYDFPDHTLKLPRRVGYLLENPCYVAYDGFIPSYRSDTL